MLTLQTLRDKGGVLLAVLIGVALLAFLLGDMLSSSSLLFGSANKVGKIDGTSINAQDYAYKLDYYSNVNEQLSGSTQDLNEKSASQAWESFVREEVFLPQIDKLGLSTSPEESQNLLSPETPSPVVAQYFSDRTGTFNSDAYKQFINSLNYDASGRLMNLLSYFKTESDFIASMNKVINVVRGGYYATDAEVNNDLALQSVAKNLKFVYKKTSTVPDSVISYGDSDIKKYYEEHKNYFRKDESKKLNYVTFNVMPSEEDFMAAQKTVDEMAVEFGTSQNARLYADANSNDKGVSKYYTRDQLETELAEFAFSGNTGVYGPKLNDKVYTMARVVEVRDVPQKMDISNIALRPDQKKLADSLMHEIENGANFSDLAMQNSVATNAAEGGKIGEVSPAELGDYDLTQKLLATPVGGCVKMEGNGGIQIFKVNTVSEVTPMAFVAMITYNVEPSKVTRNAVFNRASRFATTAAGGIDNFLSVTTDSVLELRVANVNPESTGIQGIDNSKEVVTWAFAHGEEEGTSHVMEFGDQYLVAAVASSTERGIQPLSKVRDEVETALKSELKGEYLKNQFATATSVEDAATKFNIAVTNAEDIKFSSFVFPEVGFNVGFAGAIMVAKPGQLAKPVVTTDAVFLFEVVSENKIEETDPGQVRETLSAENKQMMFQSSYMDVIENAQIVDQRYKLYR